VTARRARAEGLTNALVFVPDGWHGRLAARLRRAGLQTRRALIAMLADTSAIGGPGLP
jgi:hypothetical protein